MQHQLYGFVHSEDSAIPLSAINKRWYLSQEENENVDAVAGSVSEVNTLPQSDPLERSSSMHRLLRKIELAFRNCNSLNETSHLEDCINKGLNLHQEFVDIKNEPVQLPLAGTVPKLGRPAKEKAYSRWRDINPTNKLLSATKSETLKLPTKRRKGLLICIHGNGHKNN